MSDMTDVEVVVVNGVRERQAFSNPVVKWRFGIKYGPRTENVLVSKKLYKSPDSARKAGLRQLEVMREAFR